MVRVLIVEAAGNLWGSERSLLDLVDAMPGILPAVCCPPRMPLQNELAKKHVRILPYYVYGLHKKSRWHRLQAALGVLRACLLMRANVIYLNQSGAYRIALLAASLLRLSIIGHVRIFEDAAYLAQRRPRLRCLRGLIAISKAVEQQIRQFRELDAIPVHTIHDAYATAAPVSAAKRVGNRIACVGRLAPIKGQDVLLRALTFLQDFEGGTESLIIGDGEEEFVHQIKGIATDMPGSPLIRWLGFVNDVMPLLQTCSVLVCPSHREPLGRVIFDAWTAGVVPIVFAGSGGGAEVVAAAEGGILYAEQTPECLAMALRDALRLDPRQSARLVENGRAWVARNCDPLAYGGAVSKILTDAARA